MAGDAEEGEGAEDEALNVSTAIESIVHLEFDIILSIEYIGDGRARGGIPASQSCFSGDRRG